jgi:hypothetical protein
MESHGATEVIQSIINNRDSLYHIIGVNITLPPLSTVSFRPSSINFPSSTSGQSPPETVPPPTLMVQIPEEMKLLSSEVQTELIQLADSSGWAIDRVLRAFNTVNRDLASTRVIVENNFQFES